MTSRFVAFRTGLLAALLVGCAAPLDQAGLQPVDFDDPPAAAAQIAPLADAIGDRRIVLLGENGHGVGEHTAVKVDLIRWLHGELDFDVVVMESGFLECAHAWRRADESTARGMLYGCLRYPFEHAEILPLFELIHKSRHADRPLELAGMDPQPQGYDSGVRPVALHAPLRAVGPDLASRVAAYDSALFLVPDSGGLGDGVDAWVLEHGERARAAYDSAAARTTGHDRWAFRLAAGYVDRLLVRARARDADPPSLPPAYYELRDEWMARAVAAIADSIAGPRRVVVWLHNDHARYGDFDVDGSPVRSVGGFLREWYGDEVFSIGFFMGEGIIADNRRRERQVAATPAGGIEDFLGAGGHEAGYLVLTSNRNPQVRAWASAARPYLRMGLDEMTLVPAAEFDALFYVDRVGPPTYSIPAGGGSDG